MTALGFCAVFVVDDGGRRLAGFCDACTGWRKPLDAAGFRSALVAGLASCAQWHFRGLGVCAGLVGRRRVGHGPFVAADTASSLMLLWGCVGTLTAMPLMVTALIGEMATLEACWQGAMNDSDISVGEWDGLRGRFAFSRRWQTLLGHRTQSFEDSATTVRSRVHEAHREGIRQALDRLDNAAVGTQKLTGRMLRTDGSWAWFTGTATVVERARMDRPRACW